MSRTENSRILWIAVVGLLVITGLIWLPESLDLSEFKTQDLLPLLGLLFLLALFAERALEVLLTTWRGPEADEKDRDIELKRKKINDLGSQSRLDRAAMANAEADLKTLVDDREKYRMMTRNLALWLGLLIGIFISVVGFRVLHELVANAPEEGTTQAYVFSFVDIVLTGCLIAGGSDGIHKISELYNGFMGSTTKKARATNPPGGSASP